MPPICRVAGLEIRDRLFPTTVEFPPGVTAVIGESGAGKSTLLSLLVGFERPRSGTVDWCGNRIFWMPQDQGSWPGISAIDHLLYVMPAPDRAQAQELLAGFGLAEFAHTIPERLSFGQAARLATARAVAADPDVLVLDEPFSSTDSATANRCWELLVRWREKRQGHIIFSTHRADEVFGFADFAICLLQGAVVGSAPPLELYQNPANLDAACLLGPCTSLPAEARAALEIEDHRGLYRPEELTITAADDGLTVREMRQIGSRFELWLETDCGPVMVITTGRPPVTGKVRVGTCVAGRK